MITRVVNAARSVLIDLESQAEKVRAGIVTQAEVDVAEHANTPIVDHVDASLVHLSHKRGKGARRSVSPHHVADVRLDGECPVVVMPGADAKNGQRAPCRCGQTSPSNSNHGSPNEPTGPSNGWPAAPVP